MKVTQQIAEKGSKPFTALPKLTRKQQAFVNELVNNPKISATEAAERSYNTLNRGVANAIAGENLLKPAIISHLESYSTLTENVLIDTINRYKDSDKLEEVKESTLNARWVHDKIHGKAKQSMDINSSSISLTIDLTSALSGEADD